MKIAAAPSIPDLMKKYNFTEDQIAYLLSADPTYKEGNKVGAYTLWLIKMYKDKPERIKEDSQKLNEYLNLYHSIKRKKGIDESKKRIENFESVSDLLEFIADFKPVDEDLSEIPQSNVLFENTKWIVYEADDAETACALGANSSWCTGHEDTANEYLRTSNLQVIINKFNTRERYQYHAGSQQFMDVDDRSININEFLNKINKGDKFDSDLSLELVSIIENANTDYYEKYNDIVTEQIMDTLPDIFNYDIDEVLQNVGIDPNTVTPAGYEELYQIAQDTLFDDRPNVDATGYPDVYVSLDGLEYYIEENKEEVLKKLEQLLYQEKQQEMTDAGQLSLDFGESEEEKVALYKYKDIDEFVKKH